MSFNHIIWLTNVDIGFQPASFPCITKNKFSELCSFFTIDLFLRLEKFVPHLASTLEQLVPMINRYLPTLRVSMTFTDAM